MKYILDFDHTLCDTGRFCDDAQPYKESGLWVTPAIWDILDASQYLYAESVSFLKELEKEDVRILTAMTASLGPEARAFQKVKLEKSGVVEFVSDIIFMEGDKGPFLEEMYDGTPTVFIDDKLDHLVSAKKHCPGMYCIQILRDGDTNRMSGINHTERSAREDIPVVHSLAEASTLVNIWEHPEK